MPKQSQPQSRSLHLNHRLAYLPIQISCTLFGVLALALLCPVKIDSSSAETLPAVASTTNAQVAVQSTLSVTLSPAVNMTVTPSPDGSFTSGTANLKVSTNNSTGYSVYVSTSDESTAMRSIGLTSEIKALAAPTVADNFVNNSWGYQFAKGDASDLTAPFRGITQNLYKAESAAANTALDEYSLSFGAKVDNTIAAGNYSNEVLVSVVANPTLLTQLSELIYMQDMNPTICENTGEISVGGEVEKQLIDIRDGKKYWVAKLADQNCWMTQNLAFDLEAGKTLTPSTSDVSQDWQIPTSTSSEIYSVGSISDTSPENWAARSWDLGEYVLTEPESNTACEVFNSDNMNTCTRLQDVSSGWSPTFSAAEQNGVYSSFDQSAKTYDAHYLIGNYYQYNAATAGTGGADVFSQPQTTGDSDEQIIAKQVDAKDSICPAGWRLPTSGRRAITLSDNAPGSYPLDRLDSGFRLFSAYGFPNSPELYNSTDGSGHAYIGLHGNTHVIRTPLYMVRTGFIYPNQGYLRSAGQAGKLISSTAFENNRQDYDIVLSTFHILPASWSERHIARSVRCLAK